MEGIVQRTLFSQESVKMLHEIDFNIESDTRINIKHTECMLVLFYADNIESKKLAEIWLDAAKQAVGPIFAACNLAVDRKVAQAFNSLNMANGALHWAALKTVPFVLIYQNGWPIAFYNGERAVQPIIDYSLTLACKVDYHEPENLYGGMKIENNLKMEGIVQYGIPKNPFRKDSLQYTSDGNIRGYPVSEEELQDTSDNNDDNNDNNNDKEIPAEGTNPPELVGGVRLTPQGTPIIGAETGESEEEEPPVPTFQPPPIPN